MDKIGLNPKIIVPIVVGIVIFVTDYLFYWLSFILGPISMLFVMSLIIGLLVRDIEQGVVATEISMAIGVGICALVTPFAFGPVVSSNVEILAYLFYAGVYATRGPLFFLTGLPVYGEAIIFYFIFAPLQYFFAPGFTVIGVKIRERLRKGTQKESNMQSLVTQETPVIHEN